MRQTFTIRFLGDDQTAQTIVVTSKKGLTPTYIEEYRGKEGSERYCISYAVTAVGVNKPKYNVDAYGGEWEVRKVSDFGIQPRKWYQFWRKK